MHLLIQIHQMSTIPKEEHSVKKIEIPLVFEKRQGFNEERGVVFSGIRHRYTNMPEREEEALIKGVRRCMKEQNNVPKFCKMKVVADDGNGTHNVVMKNGETCLKGYYYDSFFDGTFKYNIMCGKLTEYAKTQ